jgi:hypothetical protein
MGLRSKLLNAIKLQPTPLMNFEVAPNLLNRVFKHEEPAKAWCLT